MSAAFPPNTGMGPYYSKLVPSTRCGIYYGPNPTPSFTIESTGQTYGPDAPITSGTYQVLNWEGVEVSSGVISGTTLNPATPAGGWAYGWYRLYLYDSTPLSAGAINFCVIRNNANFVANPAASVGWQTNGTGTDVDEVTRGIFAMGPQRYTVDSPLSPTSAITEILASAAVDTTYNNGDMARPQPRFATFSGGGTFDRVVLTTSDVEESTANVYPLNGTINGANLYVKVGAGSVTGYKVTVYYPNNTTVVETYDNLVKNIDLQFATASSAYILVNAWVYGDSGYYPQLPTTPTAIGRTNYNAIASVVSQLYPTIEWFEGPTNEPSFSSPFNLTAPDLVQQMVLFRAAVKAGASGAKAMGPCLVTANLEYTQGSYPDWPNYFAAANAAAKAASATAFDGISTHTYNTALGDLSMGRANWAGFTECISTYGYESLPVWQTEQGVFTPVYGVYHPRRARWVMLQLLVQESYGVPKEQNFYWYDISQGFWPQPTWFENFNTGLNPQAVMMRTFSEEVYGMNFSGVISLGALGDHMYFGGLWVNSSTGTSTAIFMAASPIDNGQITLTVTGSSSPLTVIDAWGNSSTVTPSSGRVTITVADAPVYVQLPNGVSVAPYSINTWSAALFENQNDLCLTRKQSSSALVANDVWENGYDGSVTPYTAYPPETATQITFHNPQRFDHVVIWSGMVWQNAGALTDFEVQVSNDGSTWTTVATVTNTPPATIDFVTDYYDTGCTVETYWDEKWIFDVVLASPVVATHLRLNTTSASYGGEPDSLCATTGGQGNSDQLYCIEEMALLLGASPLVLFPVKL